MTIHIEDLKLSCIIGILDFEREKEQDVIINLEILYEYKKEFINYADVVSCILKDMKTSKYLLLENALSSLSKCLQKEFSTIIKLELKIMKPSILPDCKVSLSEIYIFNS